jgi:hypothetical protein
MHFCICCRTSVFVLDSVIFYHIQICNFTKIELKPVLLSFWIFSKKLTEQIDRDNEWLLAKIPSAVTGVYSRENDWSLQLKRKE